MTKTSKAGYQAAMKITLATAAGRLMELLLCYPVHPKQPDND
ncbi:hypothetical protein [Nitrosomonas communis]|nr:hypothetical protein [Nitrosomonas communis]